MSETSTATQRPMQGTVSKAHDPYGQVLRVLHWAIGLFVIFLALTGYAIHFRDELGFPQLKYVLVYTHAFASYAFLAVLAVRLILPLRRVSLTSIRKVLPRKDEPGRLKRQLSGVREGKRKPRFAGRSPISRTLIGVFYASFFVLMGTGLFRAGTDIFHPPLGPIVKRYVAADGLPLSEVKPLDKSTHDRRRANHVMKVKIPIGKVHVWTGYLVLAIGLVHILGQLKFEWSLPGRDKPRGFARIMLFGPRRGSSGS